jgi:hypothetical protein
MISTSSSYALAPKSHLWRAYFTLAFVLTTALSLTSSHAVSLTMNPSSVNSAFAGWITNTLVGIGAGQSARFETFLDLNGNGSIDASDILVQSFRVTDGQVTSVAGIRNRNIPGDDDGATNGQIQCVRFSGVKAEAAWGIAHYVIRASSPEGQFTPVTVAFQITQPPYSQRVSGRVTCNGVAVPYAFVFIFQPNRGGPKVSCIADVNGNYTLNCPTGSYAIGVLKSGYVGNFSTAPQVNITSGAVLTRNLSMQTADRNLAGRLTDSVTGAGIPGVQVFGQADNGLVTLVFTDTNGNFSMPVSSASTQWSLDFSTQSAIPLGYAAIGDSQPVDLNSGNLSSLTQQWIPANALFYGRLSNNAGAPIGSVEIDADFAGYECLGIADANGDYFVGAITGDWSLEANSDQLQDLNYLPIRQNHSIASGQAIRVDLVAPPVSAHLKGKVTYANGSPLVNADIAASMNYGEAWHSVQTDSQGKFDLGVSSGDWYVSLDSDSANEFDVVGPSLRFTVTNGVSISNIVYTVQAVSAHITGSVRDTADNPIPYLGISAWCNVNGTNYNTWNETDGQGNYRLPAINAQWTVGVSSDVAIMGYQYPPNQSAIVAGFDRTVNFVMQPIVPPQITSSSASLPEGFTSVEYNAQLEAADGQQPYSWSLVPESLPLPQGLNLWDDGSISGTPTESGSFTFIARVTDSGQRTADRALTIQIRASVEIVTTDIPEATVGVFYSAQFQATNGTPPYVWGLDSPSQAPAGLTFSSSGNLYGTPEQAGTYDLMVTVRDQDFQTALRQFALTIHPGIPPLRIETTNLLGRQINLPYTNTIVVSGGVPPYQWQIPTGQLPPGLVLTNSGQIVGTPVVLGQWPFVLRVTDSQNTSVYQNYSIDIYPVPPGLPLSTSMNNDVLYGISSDGSNFLISVAIAPPVANLIQLQFLSTQGTRVGNPIQLTRAGSASAISYGASQYLVVWEDAATRPNDDIYGQYISPTGTALGSPFAICTASGRQFFDSRRPVAFDGSNTLVVWRDQRNGTDSDIYGQLVSTNGNLVGPNLAISEQSGIQMAPAVAFDGTRYLVTWMSQRVVDGFYETWGRFIARDGTTGPLFQISQTASPRAQTVRLTFGETNYMVVWNRDLGGIEAGTSFWTAVGRIVNRDGSFTTNEFYINPPSNPQLNPQVVQVGNQFLVAWLDVPVSGNPTAKARLFDATGAPVGAAFTLVDGVNDRMPLVAIYPRGSALHVFAMWSLQSFDSNGRPQAQELDLYNQILPLAPQLEAVGFTRTQQFHLRAQSLIPLTGTLEFSTNLPAWNPLSTHNLPAGTWDIYDSEASHSPQRFYRFVAP